jgi:DNA invertase Pin-like site-specific DNA recombinase
MDSDGRRAQDRAGQADRIALMVLHYGKFVSYLRVSTKRQGESGLGLEAQRHAVTSFLNGGNWQLVEEFVEVESGKHDHNRPALLAALAACKVYGATLVIAKLDRLSRDAHFLLGLQKAGVKFVAADMPEANEMVVGIMALVAQAERRMISERTKAALQAAKARGKVLGNPTRLPPRATAETRARGSATTSRKAKEFAERLRPVLSTLGHLSARAAAIELDRRGISTANGGVWSAGKVIAVRTRLGLKEIGCSAARAAA